MVVEPRLAKSRAVEPRAVELRVIDEL